MPDKIGYTHKADDKQAGFFLPQDSKLFHRDLPGQFIEVGDGMLGLGGSVSSSLAVLLEKANLNYDTAFRPDIGLTCVLPGQGEPTPLAFLIARQNPKPAAAKPGGYHHKHGAGHAWNNSEHDTRDFSLPEGTLLFHPNLDVRVEIRQGRIFTDVHYFEHLSGLLTTFHIFPEAAYSENTSLTKLTVTLPGTSEKIPLVEVIAHQNLAELSKPEGYHHKHDEGRAFDERDFFLPDGTQIRHMYFDTNAEVRGGRIFQDGKFYDHFNQLIDDWMIPPGLAYQKADSDLNITVILPGSSKAEFLGDVIARQQKGPEFAAAAGQVGDAPKPKGYYHKARRTNDNDRRDFSLPEGAQIRDYYRRSAVVREGALIVNPGSGEKRISHFDDITLYIDYGRVEVKLAPDQDWMPLRNHINQQEAEAEEQARRAEQLEQLKQGKGGFLTDKFDGLPVIVPSGVEITLPEGVTMDIIQFCIESGTRYPQGDRKVAFRFDATKAPAGMSIDKFGRLCVYLDHNRAKGTVTVYGAAFAGPKDVWKKAPAHRLEA